jgi:hypothetical protein
MVENSPDCGSSNASPEMKGSVDVSQNVMIYRRVMLDGAILLELQAVRRVPLYAHDAQVRRCSCKPPVPTEDRPKLLFVWHDTPPSDTQKTVDGVCVSTAPARGFCEAAGMPQLIEYMTEIWQSNRELLGN